MTKAEVIRLLKKMFVNCDTNRCSHICAYCDEAINIAIGALEQELNWIPVSERLPEENSFVLVTIMPGTVTDAGTSLVYDTLMAHYSLESGEDQKFQITGFGDVFLNEEVIAWQPLPEPYEDDAE